MSLYKTLASQFVQEIEDGKLSEGSRMPSLRQLAKQQAVSMSTAVSCYQELPDILTLSQDACGYPVKYDITYQEWIDFECQNEMFVGKYVRTVRSDDPWNNHRLCNDTIYVFAEWFNVPDSASICLIKHSNQALCVCPPPCDHLVLFGNRQL